MNIRFLMHALVLSALTFNAYGSSCMVMREDPKSDMERLLAIHAPQHDLPSDVSDTQLEATAPPLSLEDWAALLAPDERPQIPQPELPAVEPFYENYLENLISTKSVLSDQSTSTAQSGLETDSEDSDVNNAHSPMHFEPSAPLFDENYLENSQEARVEPQRPIELSPEEVQQLFPKLFEDRKKYRYGDIPGKIDYAYKSIDPIHQLSFLTYLNQGLLDEKDPTIKGACAEILKLIHPTDWNLTLIKTIRTLVKNPSFFGNGGLCDFSGHIRGEIAILPGQDRLILLQALSAGLAKQKDGKIKWCCALALKIGFDKEHWTKETVLELNSWLEKMKRDWYFSEAAQILSPGMAKREEPFWKKLKR